jgi:YVTN family beta-propeller protein
MVIALLAAVLVASSAPLATAKPFAFITNSSDDTVSVIDTADNSVFATISIPPPGFQPIGVAVNPARTRVYVVNVNPGSAGTISVIDTTTNPMSIVATVTVGPFPFGVAVSPTGDRVYVGNIDETISVISTSTHTVVETIDDVRDPQGLAVSPDGTRLYVANCDFNTVTVIDTTTSPMVKVKTIDVGNNAQGIAVAPDGAHVYVGNADDNTVSIIQTSDNTVVGNPVMVGSGPLGIAVHPAGSHLYVANTGDDTVSVIRTADNAVATVALPPGASPWGLAVTPAGTRVFVANSNLNNVSVIDTTTDPPTLLTDIAVGVFPTAFGDFIGPGATHLSVTAPASATAGIAFSFSVSALDQYGHVDTSYTGTVHFTSGDGQAALPANTTLTSGAGTFSATLKTAGNQTITATDTAAITGTSGAIAVNAAAATHFSLSVPASATAGTAFSFTVTALDPFNNTATGYAGTVHFTSGDGQAVLPANTTLTNGTGTFSATLKTAGNQTITATDTVTAAITGTSNAIAVSAAATGLHYTISTPASATASTAFSFTVSARDQFNNTATSYGGTVHFTSSDVQAILPANATLTNGVGTFGATLKTSGSQTITGTDTVTASITGTSNAIAVSAVATHLQISAPASVARTANGVAGTSLSFTVTALDQANNVVTGYTGTVHFASTDPRATLPGNSTLTNGTGTFTATLRTAGSQTITGTDTTNPSITGTSDAIVVSPAAATHFSISAPASIAAGAPFSFTVTALDPFDNVATGYGGTVRFTSSDPQATLPANATLTNGVGTFSATLRTGGNQTLTATDTVNGAITGSATIAASAVPVPTLGTWAFLLLAMLLATVAVRAIRARQV